MISASGRRVLVTGAGGFIGGHLVAELVGRGADVRAFCRYNSRADRGSLEWIDPEITREVEVVFGNLRDLESLKPALSGVDTLLHLGAEIGVPYSYVNPRGFFETNVLGTLNVATVALETGVEQLVHVSTSEVYGAARQVPMTEDHPLEPRSPYAASKLAADKLMESYHRTYQLPVSVVRPFNTYGPRQSARAVIPTTISQGLVSDRLILGSMHPRRDFTYVEDTVAGLVAAALEPACIGRTLQLGTGQDVAIAEIIEIVAELLGKELHVHTDPRRIRPSGSEVERLVCDPGLARQLIGWDAKVSLRDGLSATIEAIRSSPTRYAVEEYVT